MEHHRRSAYRISQTRGMMNPSPGKRQFQRQSKGFPRNRALACHATTTIKAVPIRRPERV